MPRAAQASLLFLAAAATAYPERLECAADNETRLRPGAPTMGSFIMGGPVKACTAGCEVAIATTQTASGATAIRVTTSIKSLFVIRVSDGAGNLSYPAYSNTSDTGFASTWGTCAGQMYSYNSSGLGLAAGTFDFALAPSARGPSATPVIKVGYVNVDAFGSIVTVVRDPPLKMKVYGCDQAKGKCTESTTGWVLDDCTAMCQPLPTPAPPTPAPTLSFIIPSAAPAPATSALPPAVFSRSIPPPRRARASTAARTLD
eukprot:gene11550-9529_t